MLTWVTLSVVSGWLILRAGYRAGDSGSLFFTRLRGARGPRRRFTYREVWLAMGVSAWGWASPWSRCSSPSELRHQKLIATATSASIFFRTIGGTVGRPDGRS
jgi:hypothetical protein